MPTLMHTFTVRQKLEGPADKSRGEHLAIQLVDLLKLNCPDVLDDMVGFMLMKELDAIFVTFTTEVSAQRCYDVFISTASLTQYLKRTFDDDRPNPAKN